MVCKCSLLSNYDMIGQQLVMVNQLLIALKHAKPGSHFIVKASCKAQSFAMSVIVMLQILFGGECAAIKSNVCHKVRSSIYLVCRDMKKNPASMINQLEMSKNRLEKDSSLVLDSVASTIDVTSHILMEKLAKYLTPIWQQQSRNIYAKIKEIHDADREERLNRKEMRQYYGKQWQEGWWY